MANKLYDNGYIDFYGKKIHVVVTDAGNVWFNLNDIGSALGLSDVRDSVRKNSTLKMSTRPINELNVEKPKSVHGQTQYINEGGMYMLITRSRKPKATEFTNWVSYRLLPSIRQGHYDQLMEEFAVKTDDLNGQIRILRETIKRLEGNAKKDKYPEGGVVYVIAYPTEDGGVVYRLGRSSNMKRRKYVYDTHTRDRNPVVFIKKAGCPVSLETCVRAMLYSVRVRDRKDFYDCSLRHIKKAFRACVKNIDLINGRCPGQSGGGDALEVVLYRCVSERTRLRRRSQRLKRMASKYELKT